MKRLLVLALLLLAPALAHAQNRQLYRNLPDLPVFDLRKYGANGSDSSADNAEIARLITAVNAAGGGEIIVPAGTYYIDESSPITIGDNTHFVGVGRPTFKVRAGAGNYQELFKTADAVRNRISFRGIIFDQNTANGSSAAGVGPLPGTASRSHFIFGLNANYVRFEDCTFNCHGVNTIVTVSGNTGLDVIRCQFNFSHYPHSSYAFYDNSLIYSLSRFTNVDRCEFLAATAAGQVQAMGAVELHAADSSVTRCRSVNYATLCNVAADAGFTGWFNARVEGNNAEACNQGISLFPGGSLKGTKIVNNNLQVKQLTWGHASFWGIGSGTGTAAVTDVDVTLNHVELEQEDNARSTTSTDPDGLAMQQYAGGGILLNFDNAGCARIRITGNRVVSAPFNGIRLGGEGATGTYADCEITGNWLLDCGHYPGADSVRYEAYVHLRGTFSDTFVTDNRFIERFATTRAIYWIHASVGTYATTCRHGRNETVQPASVIANSLAANWGAATN